MANQLGMLLTREEHRSSPTMAHGGFAVVPILRRGILASTPPNHTRFVQELIPGNEAELPQTPTEDTAMASTGRWVT
jgi:hypothetical protein